MCKLYFVLFLLLNFSLLAQQTYIPDDNFEQALIHLGYDSGGLNDSVPTTNINTITSLNVSDKSITNMIGIEDFTALTTLRCFSNQITNLDVSANKALRSLYCGSNLLTNLDVSSNKNLTLLNCITNQLNQLDISTNVALKHLDCSYNPLTNLNVNMNTSLTNLTCVGNQLTTLDVSANTALTYLKCSVNQLSNLELSLNTALTFLDCCINQLINLEVSANTALSELWCYNNQISSLDVSENTNLVKLHCATNQLSILDVTTLKALTLLACGNNQLINLDVRNGNNSKITGFGTKGNPELTCIYVDDRNASYLTSWVKDSSSSFVNNVTECEELIETVTKISNPDKLRVYPNPVKDQFNIETNKEIETIMLYNVSGKLVKTFKIQNSYSISDLNKGLYIMEIHCTENTFTQKLFIE